LSAVTNDEAVVVVEVDVITSVVVDNSFSEDGVVTTGEISAVEGVVITSSEDVVVD